VAVDLTISIVNTNNRDLLRNCLRSIFENTHHLSLEVVVVDNVCIDGSADMVKAEFPQVKLILNQRRLRFCANHNQALKPSQGRYLLILNEDTVVTPGAFDAVVEFMDGHPRVGIAGVTLLNPDGSLQWSYADFPNLLSSFLYATTLTRLSHKYPHYPLLPDDQPMSVDWVSGACLFVRRETISDIGYLDEQFLIYYEETDWCYRARQAGWDVCYLPGVEIYHWQGQSTSQERSRRRFRVNRSRLLFFRKHYSTLSAFSFRVILVVTSLLRLAYWLPRRLWDKRELARQEVVYNWRTVLISIVRDDLFDGELFQMN